LTIITTDVGSVIFTDAACPLTITPADEPATANVSPPMMKRCLKFNMLLLL
jgi:hypothetical protein